MNTGNEGNFSSKELQDVISFLHDNDYKLLNTAKGLSCEGSNKEYLLPEEEPKLYILINNKTKSAIELKVSPEGEVFAADLLLEGNIKYTIDDNPQKGIDSIEEMYIARNFKKQLFMEVGSNSSYDNVNGSKMIYSINLLNKELDVKNLLKTIKRMEEVGTFIPTGLDKVLSMSNLNPLIERVVGKNEVATVKYQDLTKNIVGLMAINSPEEKRADQKLKIAN